jgi:hypothetical protein
MMLSHSKTLATTKQHHEAHTKLIHGSEDKRLIAFFKKHLTRGDDIKVDQENNDHNDFNVDVHVPANNTDQDDDTMGKGTAATSGAAGGNGTVSPDLIWWVWVMFSPCKPGLC